MRLRELQGIQGNEANQYKEPTSDIKSDEERPSSIDYINFFRELNQSVYRINGTKYFTTDTPPVFNMGETIEALERNVDNLPLSIVIRYGIDIDRGFPKVKIIFDYSANNEHKSEHKPLEWMPKTSDLPDSILSALERLNKKSGGLGKILSGSFRKNEIRVEKEKEETASRQYGSPQSKRKYSAHFANRR